MKRRQYGKSQITQCIFCEKQATMRTTQGAPTCNAHRQAELNTLFCYCGVAVEPKIGAYGLFFLCESCGPLSLKKILENNIIYDVNDA